jgi:hypothetical protein
MSVPAGIVTTNFNISPINDGVYEGSETVIMGVSGGAGYSVASSNTATATIIDDDFPIGTTLFSDNFETNSASRWVVNFQNIAADATADFGYDYSVDNVPPAPGGVTTKGLRFQVNVSNSPPNAVSASPIDINLPSEYRLRFNMWNNYNGSPMFDGGAGSTMHVTAGVGTTPDHVNFHSSGASDGIWFAASGDGGSTLAVGDSSAYAPTLLNDDSGVYAAGTNAPNSGVRKTTDPYYALWGNIPAPAGQVAAYPTVQTGLSGPGNYGVSWHTVGITKTTSTVTWVIDGILLATIPADSTPLGTNVFVGFMDAFAGTGGVGALRFGIIDNLRVETLITAPPGSISITRIAIVGSNVEITFTGPADRNAYNFTLQSSATVGSGYGDIASTPTDISPGVFKLSAPLGGSIRFYRIKL